ncbi:acetyl-CoA hydrolase/transferase family protein [Novosphingobium pentaromativorans]|uniref:Acetyl-CoA hydrolase/transferase n=1 Tax=Novosphingobium pentaromativorans US6-1 TaxID=1088721 RepID=G6E6W3_9SPHN|nr:acetyl-CoA hydrolase/transferase C-terminal domain-containing protein [Novosphingobium pentaromativorans]AIT78395.1 4-hydroxybutyrate CoA-transferase [Novosphingobium pentaromativorans US6-1]EHJ63009.1 acetyl-CoA hydrolase/transferase [Novosphingobium pentaromativorans US6-1]
MSPQDLYRAKLTTADDAVAQIGSGMNVSMGMATAEPPALLEALGRRIENSDFSDLCLWYFHSLEAAGKTVLREDLLDRVRPHCMFLSHIERTLIKGDPSGSAYGPIEFVPVAFSGSPQLLSERLQLDACITTVSAMDRHGWFTFGTSNDYTSAAARSARRLIVEVNPAMPRVFGDSLLHVSEIDAIVENHCPLPEIVCCTPSAEEQVIASIIAGMIDDRACLQMGIGTLPAAVCGLLEDRKDLGIHTELMTPALARLIECGAVTNMAKATYRGRSVFTFAMGDAAFYDFLDDNPAFHSLPVNLVNDPRHISKNDNVVSVNGTLQIDLGGACNSEHRLGRQYSGSGGQLDFVRGATASKGGKSIIACQSTARDGAVSRIVPVLDGPVTTPRNDTHIVVTEYGWADLRGKSMHQRADALIGLAHPRFRDELANSVR